MIDTIKKNKAFYISFFLIAVGIIIRLVFINYISFTLDESQSFWQAAHALTGKNNFFIIMANDVHPPLFNLILHFWMKISHNVAWLRILPLFFNIVTIPIMYLLAKEVYTRTEGFIALLVCSFSPIWVWYALDVRSYTLFVLFAAISFLLFFKILHNKENALLIILYICVQALGMLTHYFFIFVIVTELVGAIMYNKKSIWIYNILAGILFLPWAIFFLKNHLTSTQPSLGSISLFNMMLTLFELSIGYHSSNFYRVVISAWPLLILLPFIYVSSFRRIGKKSILLILAVIMPILISFLISQYYITIFLTRYLLFVSIPLYLLMIHIIFSNFAYKRQLFVAFMCGVIFFLLIVNEFLDPYNIYNENYRDAVGYIQTHAKQTDLIVISAPFTIYPFEYYYTGTINYTTLPFWDRIHSIDFTPSSLQMSELVKTAQKKHLDNIYLMESYDQSHHDDTIHWFGSHLSLVAQKAFGYNVSVYRYKLASLIE